VLRSTSGERSARESSLIEAAAALGVFYAVTAASRRVEVALYAMALAGLLFPLAWGKVTGQGAEMGFTGDGLPDALAWGVGTGIVSSIIGYVTVPERSLTADVGRQLAVGIPLWLLLASPFQEFFFRGWLQPRWERGLGKGWGLLVATIGFTGWNYLLPIFGGSGQSSFPLYSLKGLAATFGAGLVYGYGFRRSGSIVAPWLAHALSGIMFVAVGASSFLPPGP
jgi:membrane protease YdiL (CAAX protease family)